MDSLTAFVDESGSIKKRALKRKDFFVIAMIFTDNERFLNKVFKKKRFQILNEEERKILREPLIKCICGASRLFSATTALRFLEINKLFLQNRALL